MSEPTGGTVPPYDDSDPDIVPAQLSAGRAASIQHDANGVSDLWSFFKARLDEAEARARKDIQVADRATRGDWDAYYGVNMPHSLIKVDGRPAIRLDTSHHDADALLLRRFQPSAVRARAELVLAEVEVKRRIMRAHEKWCEGRCEATYPDVGPDAAYYWAMKVHASVYANHPDYLEEWRA